MNTTVVACNIKSIHRNKTVFEDLVSGNEFEIPHRIVDPSFDREYIYVDRGGAISIAEMYGVQHFTKDKDE
jgi:hypothetical protein